MTDKAPDFVIRWTKKWHNTEYPAISPSRPHLNLSGKSVIITGGGSGVGTGFVTAFAQAGVSDMLIVGRTESTLLDMKHKTTASHPNTNIHTAVADITDLDAMVETFGTFSSRALNGRPVDILVANAGYQPPLQPIASVSADDWWRGYEINVRGSFNTLRAFIPVASNSAVIVHVAAALEGFSKSLPYFSGYVPSKSASTKLFDSFQAEHPEFRVHHLHPGILRSRMTRDVVNAGTPIDNYDDPSLPGGWAVWLAASPQAEFLKGKYIWSNWDVEELQQRADEIRNSELLTIGLKA